MALIGDRRGVDPEAVTEPAPATMRARLDAAIREWALNPLRPRTIDSGTPECDEYLDFIAGRLVAGTRERLDAAMAAWMADGNVMLWGDGERDRFLDFVAKRLEES
jgi:hypothetical protein